MIEFGDCRDIMRRWASQGVKVQTCVTSPPYYGLRDYGHESQIGLEETPEQYIEAMVEVFRCVKDVLADDGTLWLNIGDSYYNYRPGKGQSLAKQTVSNNEQDLPKTCARRGNKLDGLKEKDLIGIPWMLAFALRADGWYLRQDIIWHKPNPMPESVKDRCMKAVGRKPFTQDMAGGGSGMVVHSGYKKADGTLVIKPTRNKRSFWTVTTKPYSGAHFATFPPDLIEPCILAGAPVGGVVLDPFMGSGTTAAVAIKHKRKYLGCELNPEYKPLQDERIKQAEMETAQMELI